MDSNSKKDISRLTFACIILAGLLFQTWMHVRSVPRYEAPEKRDGRLVRFDRVTGEYKFWSEVRLRFETAAERGRQEKIRNDYERGGPK